MEAYERGWEWAYRMGYESWMVGLCEGASRPFLCYGGLMARAWRNGRRCAEAACQRWRDAMGEGR